MTTIRAIVTVRRGMTDATPVIVFPWEIPLLEELHGEGSCEVHDIDGLSAIKGATMISKLKLRHTEVAAPDMAAQLLTMANSIPEDSDPFDPQSEYSRLENVYGMHPEIKVSLVEKVYGRLDSGLFASKLEIVKGIALGGVAEMTGADIRDALRAKGVDFKTATPVHNLKERLELILKLEEDGLDFNVNAPIKELKELAEAMA